MDESSNSQTRKTINMTVYRNIVKYCTPYLSVLSAFSEPVSSREFDLSLSVSS